MAITHLTKILLLIFTTHVVSFHSAAQEKPEVVVPAYNDTYSGFVKKLESGQTDINYKAFRESFIESEQFKIAAKKSAEFDSLKKEMRAQVEKSNYPEIVKITKALLSIDYTDMMAHKMLRQTYKILGDTVNAKKYKDIQFGLLNSIVKNGDGKTCATAWPVIQIEEEYFILEMLGARLSKQSISNDGGMCDKMEVKVDGKKRTYYFETTKVFQGYKKLGIK